MKSLIVVMPQLLLPVLRSAVLLAFFLLPSWSYGALSISEFLTSNGGGLQDEDLQSPGWIEIYNSGPGAVNLGGWHLADDAGDLTGKSESVESKLS